MSTIISVFFFPNLWNPKRWTLEIIAWSFSLLSTMELADIIHSILLEQYWCTFRYMQFFSLLLFNLKDAIWSLKQPICTMEDRIWFKHGVQIKINQDDRINLVECFMYLYENTKNACWSSGIVKPVGISFILQLMLNFGTHVHFIFLNAWAECLKYLLFKVSYKFASFFPFIGMTWKLCILMKVSGMQKGGSWNLEPCRWGNVIHSLFLCLGLRTFCQIHCCTMFLNRRFIARMILN